MGDQILLEKEDLLFQYFYLKDPKRTADAKREGVEDSNCVFLSYFRMRKYFTYTIFRQYKELLGSAEVYFRIVVINLCDYLLACCILHSMYV